MFKLTKPCFEMMHQENIYFEGLSFLWIHFGKDNLWNTWIWYINKNPVINSVISAFILYF